MQLLLTKPFRRLCILLGALLLLLSSTSPVFANVDIFSGASFQDPNNITRLGGTRMDMQSIGIRNTQENAELFRNARGPYNWYQIEHNGETRYFRCDRAVFVPGQTCIEDINGGRAFHNTLNELRAADPEQTLLDRAANWSGDQLARGLFVFFIWVLQFFIWLLGISGVLLEFIIDEFILGMSRFVGSGGIMSIALVSAWSAIRDIANIAFIGGLVWASIAMILNLQSAKPTSVIIKVLIAALLVNFSFFFAAIVVDASNFISGEIYEAGIRGTEEAREPIALRGESVEIPGLSAVFMQKTRLSSILDSGALNTDNPTLTGFLAAILGSILFAVTAYVFFAAAFLLVARFVVLTILLITSPVGVLRWMGLPYISDLGKKWWEALISQSLFAPVFFLFVGIAMKIITPLSNSMGGGTLSALSTEDFETSVSTLALFVISIAFIWASLVIARKISSEAKGFAPVYAGANRAKNWAVSGLGTANRYAGGLVGGLPGAVVGGAMGLVVGKPTEGWKTGRRIGTNLYGRATTPLNIIGEKAASEIEAKKIFTDKGQKYYEKDVPTPYKEKTVAYGSEEFQKLQGKIQRMSDKDLVEMYKEEKSSKKRGDILIASDSDQRRILRRLNNPNAEEGEPKAKIEGTENLDGDRRTNEALKDVDEAVTDSSAEAGDETQSKNDKQSDTEEIKTLLKAILETSKQTAENTKTGSTAATRQRVIERLKERPDSVREEYNNLQPSEREALREVVTTEAAEQPNDESLKKIVEEINTIEASPAGMVAPQNTTGTDEEMIARRSRSRMRARRLARRRPRSNI